MTSEQPIATSATAATATAVSAATKIEDTLHPAHELGLKMLLAGVSNATSACITNPADLVSLSYLVHDRRALSAPRVRLTSDVPFTIVPTLIAGLSPGFFTTLAAMVRHEGFLSIYNGVSASILREMSYSGIRMGCYDKFKHLILSTSPSLDSHSVGVKLGAGLCSGMLGSAVANPADVLKVRLQAVGGSRMGLIGHAQAVYAEHGIAGFYRAVVPTVLRAGILTSSQLGSYDVAKHFVRSHYSHYLQEGMVTHLLCSGFAGFMCSVTSAPIDTVKVRMMNDSKDLYKSSLDCAYKMLRYEGPLAFYKGFFGCWIRLWPHTVISLVLLEKLRAFAGLNPI